MNFLRVDGTFERGEVRGWVYGAQEYGFILVHSSICKEKSRVGVRDDRGRRD